MKSLRLLPLACALAGALAPAAAQAGGAGAIPSAEEYAVWSVLLDTLMVDSATTRIVLMDSTAPPGAGSAGRAGLANLLTLGARQMAAVDRAAQEAMDDFVARNARGWPLEKRFRTRVPVQWYGAESGPPRPDALPDGALSSRVYDAGLTGSKGVVRLSRVGFDRERTLAVTIVDHLCGGLCGEGALVVLRRQPDGGWRLAEKVILWAS